MTLHRFRTVLPTLLLLAAPVPPRASAQSVLHSLPGAAAGNNASPVAAAGDVDGDGHADVIVGEPHHSTLFGLARVRSGKDGLVLMTFSSSKAAFLGEAVACAGDADADGTLDLLVGAPFESAGGNANGAVLVVSGKTGATIRKLVGASALSLFGAALDGAGDLDADGFDDAVIGAPNVGNMAGEVRGFSGQSGALLFKATGLANAALGFSVSRAGDVDGDGFADVVAGAPSLSGSGVARVLSGKDGSVLLEVGGSPGDQTGMTVAGGADVNGDGTPDLLIGAPSDATAGADAGAARVLSGKDGSPIHALLGGAGDQLGSAVDVAGDVDGDGTADLVVAAGGSNVGGPASGLVRLFSGATGGELLAYAGGAGDQAGNHVAGVGDVDQDGRADIAVGAEYADANGVDSGRVDVVRLESCGASAAYGAACPGSGGFAPALSVEGCAKAGSTLVISLDQGPGGAFAMILFGTTPAALPLGGGCALHVVPFPFFAPFKVPGSGAGQGSVALPVSVPPSLSGTFVLQGVVADPGSPIGLTLTNGWGLGFP